MPSSEAMPDVSAPPAEPAPRRRTKPLITHQLWIAIITATGTIAAAVIGTVVAVDVGTVEVRMVGDGPNSVQLQSAVDRLEAENAELRSANEELQTQVGELQQEPASASTGAPGAEGSPGEAPEDDDAVLRATTEPIGLAAACLDLDSDAPNWDVADEGDICIGSLWWNFIGSDLTVLDEKPSEADCEAQTHLRDDVGGMEALVGKYVCAWTDAGRLARIEVVDAKQEEESATLDITVWEQQH